MISTAKSLNIIICNTLGVICIEARVEVMRSEEISSVKEIKNRRLRTRVSPSSLLLFKRQKKEPFTERERAKMGIRTWLAYQDRN